MRVTPLPEFQSEALQPQLDFAPVEAALRALAKEGALDLHEGHGRSIWCALPEGEFGAKKRGEGVLLFARAHQVADLAPLEARLTALTGVAPRWISAADAGAYPANFSLGRVARITRIARRFLRLRIEGPGLARLAASDSIHFRLILPQPDPAAPHWPRIGANGQTIWSDGITPLHRPVYTVGDADPAADWIETDIFLHAGGRTSDWAETAQPGMELGLAGPSGGGIPESDHLWLAGDETALPAIRRILAARPQAQGRLWLLGDGADYPLTPPPGIICETLPDMAALARVIAASDPPGDAYLWMAGERAGIAALRADLIEARGISPRQSHLSAYWTASPQKPQSSDQNPTKRPLA